MYIIPKLFTRRWSAANKILTFLKGQLTIFITYKFRKKACTPYLKYTYTPIRYFESESKTGKVIYLSWHKIDIFSDNCNIFL